MDFAEKEMSHWKARIELQSFFDFRDGGVFHPLANKNFSKHEIRHAAVRSDREHIRKGFARVIPTPGHDVANPEQERTVGIAFGKLGPEFFEQRRSLSIFTRTEEAKSEQ